MISLNRKKSFNLLCIFYLVTIAYTILLIGWINHKIGGGPCNGGIVLLFIVFPFLFFIVAMFFMN